MVNENASIIFPKAQKINLSYDLSEDRLIILALLIGNVRRQLTLTRRIYIALLNSYIKLMQEVSHIQNVPFELRQEAFLLEHIGALNDEALHENGQEWIENQTRSDFGSPFLVLEVKLQIERDSALIGFLGVQACEMEYDLKAAQPLFALTMDRNTTHKFLKVLVQEGLRAEWNNPIDDRVLSAIADQKSDLLTAH